MYAAKGLMRRNESIKRLEAKNKRLRDKARRAAIWQLFATYFSLKSEIGVGIPKSEFSCALCCSAGKSLLVLQALVAALAAAEVRLCWATSTSGVSPFLFFSLQHAPTFIQV